MIDTDSLPKGPGCYLFKDRMGRIIYIGKARDIKKRVVSYFTKTQTDAKTLALVKAIASVDFFATDTEVEALILENTLIKKHQPRYNIQLRDSKRYAWLKITDEQFPRLILARMKTADGKYFGPFVSAASRDDVKAVLTKSFKLRTCRRLPKKECLRYHLGLCSAPCTDMISSEDYSISVKQAEMVLRGNIREISGTLKVEMKRASDTQDYERALENRRRIEAVSWLTEKQKMERDKHYDEDIINYMERDGKVYLMLFNIHKGTLENKQSFVFEETPRFLEEFVLQHYSENNPPKELILPEKVQSPLKELFRFRTIIPSRGPKKQLLELVSRNIELQFFRSEERLKDLKTKLRLFETPGVIEAFDISHLSGTSTVGSMVTFRQGTPDKSNYRRFKIRTVTGIDDYAAIAEVVRRRYSRLIAEKQSLPDLIIIDGGKGQLSAAVDELKNLDIMIPIISIAKREEEVFVPGLSIPIPLGKKSEGLNLIREIRDEAHRFAISYNRLLRSREMKA